MSRSTSARVSGLAEALCPLHPGAKEHYEDARAYEERYQARSEDIDYYLRKCRGAASVLEYGAGAGRLTIPVAGLGVPITAVDASQSMLELLRRNLKSLDKDERALVRVKHADMRLYRTSKKFEVVVAAFHTLCHLYNHADIVAFLQRVRRHLLPGGRFEFDLPLPRIDVPEYDPISQVRVTCMGEGDKGRGQLLTQRWYQPQEICAHLHYNGFESIRLGSDFSRELPHSETSVFTVSARVPK